ncbi:hypothetical protein Calag_1298 [Caldisphaera lagunensis DSM 15908]|uniref:Uncharacterized protein n=1 Tax=Caldisphaera lagunensis (strain DSM 15908 / JCM 11604 / ANMR 0165 / IC-154) TaxID=1056495 RepID=L0ACZ6_CALLD|nr:hypothetical protein Calag_1298 [Caldisphaera lagunensis DSM 15908]
MKNIVSEVKKPYLSLWYRLAPIKGSNAKTSVEPSPFRAEKRSDF